MLSDVFDPTNDAFFYYSLWQQERANMDRARRFLDAAFEAHPNLDIDAEPFMGQPNAE